MAPPGEASWTASVPTPPAAPDTTTVLPARRSGRRPALRPMPWRPRRGATPATSHSKRSAGLWPSWRGCRDDVLGRAGPTFFGRAEHLIAGDEGLRRQRRPRPPPRRGRCPDPTGTSPATRSCSSPLRMFASPGLIPAAFTWTSTCPGTARPVHLPHLQHVDPAVVVEPDCSWHRATSCVMCQSQGATREWPTFPRSHRLGQDLGSIAWTVVIVSASSGVLSGR